MSLGTTDEFNKSEPFVWTPNLIAKDIIYNNCSNGMKAKGVELALIDAYEKGKAETNQALEKRIANLKKILNDPLSRDLWPFDF